MKREEAIAVARDWLANGVRRGGCLESDVIEALVDAAEGHPTEEEVEEHGRRTALEALYEIL